MSAIADTPALPTVPCIFFAREGFCAKGKYCSFSHDDSRRPLCKYLKEGRCKYGNSCAFSHNTQNVVRSVAAPQNELSREISSNLATPPEKLLPNETKDGELAGSSAADSEVQLDAWGNVKTSMDGVYFYGAPGTAFQTDQKKLSDATNRPNGSYAKIAASGLNDGNTDCSDLPQFSRGFLAEREKRNVCPFFKAGNCRFGRTCRNLHSTDSSSNNDSTGPDESLKTAGEAFVDEDAIDKECGICMGLPTNGTYGILSHCNCIFCLKCIREWRSEGIAVTKKSDQVRLCPLCRTPSYFVCPSTKAIRSVEERALLLEQYKASLASKPCKHFREDGTCPFGNSCFYLHIRPDGTLEEREPPTLQLVLTADATLEVKRKNVLADFIR